METIIYNDKKFFRQRGKWYDDKTCMSVPHLQSTLDEHYSRQLILNVKRKSQTNIEIQNRKTHCQCIDYLVNERKVKYLMHFTPIPNLSGISRYGIVPVDALPPDVVPVRLDKDRLDNHLDYSSFSIAFPSYQQLYKKRLDHENLSFAVISIDIEALRDIEYQNIIYAYDNAAGSLMPLDQLHGLEACKMMFREDAVDSKGNCISRSDLHIPDYYTTYPQAEVMVRGIIVPQYIHEIDVIDIQDREQAFNNLSDDLKSKVTVSGRYFCSRNDYQFWSKNGKQTGF